MTPSVNALIRFRLVRAAAIAAMIAFGVQGAVASPVVGPAHTSSVPAQHTTVVAGDPAPAHIILPVAPAEIAQPSPQQRPPSFTPHAATAPSGAVLVAPATPSQATAFAAASRPAAPFYPPYAARAPPVLS